MMLLDCHMGYHTIFGSADEASLYNMVKLFHRFHWIMNQTVVYILYLPGKECLFDAIVQQLNWIHRVICMNISDSVIKRWEYSHDVSCIIDPLCNIYALYLALMFSTLLAQKPLKKGVGMSIIYKGIKLIQSTSIGKFATRTYICDAQCYSLYCHRSIIKQHVLTHQNPICRI